MKLRTALIVFIAIISGLGLWVELAHWLVGDRVSDALLEHLSLSFEGNVPTWASAMLLFSCAIAAGQIAREATAWRKHWWGMAVVFGYASMDEAAEIHEHLGGHIGTGGVLYFDWVVIAVAILVALVVIYLPFVIQLPPHTRKWIIISGAVYLGGAVGMELPLGWWFEKHGQGLGYAIIDWVEETTEMIGAAMALLTLVRHRRG